MCRFLIVVFARTYILYCIHFIQTKDTSKSCRPKQCTCTIQFIYTDTIIYIQLVLQSIYRGYNRKRQQSQRRYMQMLNFRELLDNYNNSSMWIFVGTNWKSLLQPQSIMQKIYKDQKVRSKSPIVFIPVLTHSRLFKQQFSAMIAQTVYKFKTSCVSSSEPTTISQTNKLQNESMIFCLNFCNRLHNERLSNIDMYLDSFKRKDNFFMHIPS